MKPLALLAAICLLVGGLALLPDSTPAKTQAAAPVPAPEPVGSPIPTPDLGLPVEPVGLVACAAGTCPVAQPSTVRPTRTRVIERSVTVEGERPVLAPVRRTVRATGVVVRGAGRVALAPFRALRRNR